MKIAGIIAEYNPFHNGHMYHLEQVKLNHPDLIIAVVSSSMTMRGDLSIFDKFTKARHCLEAGIDLVIELPLAYSMQRGDIFAENAVRLLKLSGATELVFGSEECNPSLYEELYQREALESGKNTSMKMAGRELLTLGSNDTLGYFYYKAVKDNGFSMVLRPIQRIHNNYKDTELTNGISSATAIRRNLEHLESEVPSFVARNRDKILQEEMLFPFLRYKILSTKSEELNKIFFVDEGIEYKLKDIKDYSDFDSFITYLSGKKYTKTRMKRMLMYILYNITKDEMNSIQKNPVDTFRVLGYSPRGREYLNTIKKEQSFYTNIKDGLHPVWDIELKVTKILDSILGTSLLRGEQAGPVKEDFDENK